MRLSLPPGQSAKERLLGDGRFEIDERPEGLRLSRKRRVPSRGIFRLFIPQVRVLVAGGPEVTARVRPDGLATFISFMLLAGVVGELTMSRAKYPRDYPPAFIYGFAGAYFLLLIVEIVATRRALRRAVSPF